jgi:lipoprotein NlpD
LAILVLSGCATRTSAPVVSRGPSSAPAATTPAAAPASSATSRAADGGAEFYTVKRGDTLYSIALDHGYSYRELAEWNNLANPNVIRVDQALRVKPPADQGGVQVRPLAGTSAAEARPLSAPGDAIKSEPKAVKMPYTDENLALLAKPRSPAAPAPAVAAAKAASPAEARPAPQPAQPAAPQQADAADDDEKIDFGWPTAGKVTAGYSEGSNKGLDIGGKSGQPVVASASGTVLYVGSGIRGYGKLIVIRHNKAYSTVYAHNSEILVKEGQRVVKGQKVAEMGNSDADQVKLHFEVRRLGKPIDPTRLLPAG